MFMLLGCWFYKSSRGSGKSLTWSDLEQSQTGSKNLLTQTSMAGSLNTKQLNLLVLLRFALMSHLWSGHPWKQLSKSLVTVVVVSNFPYFTSSAPLPEEFSCGQMTSQG